MENHGGGSFTGGTRRTQADRDAITVEIGYALCSAAFAAALVCAAVVGPVFAFGLTGGPRRALLLAGTSVACLVFAARVVAVLIRFHPGTTAQPSQPGRTSPDS
ncbi:DUF6332 family protein [Streptomyces sp. NPDC046978]|uniref:DUF6332 family protein n=1 Tax=Streptomyces sp. NPDC046978 TaxID=3154704 RepID=UPI0033D2A314